MINQAAIDAFRAGLRGELIDPQSPNYNAARKVYNGMIDRRPRLIARCADVADVITAVGFAREHKLLLAVRGGGHNAGGLGVCDDGLVIDLSLIKYVRVDPKKKTIVAGGGCLWGDVDHAAHAFGLAVPSGIISTTGVGGLTLGGGLGHLTRRCGLTIDNLLAVDMVLADGRFVTASAKENPDLFWAVRGGGGNFGVVTAFTFKAHDVHTNYAGPTLYPLEDSAEVMRWYQQVHREGAERAQWVLRVHDRSAGPAVSRASAPQEDVRRRVVLLRSAEKGRAGLQADSSVQEAGARSGRTDSASGAPEHVRRPLPAGAAVVLEGRLRARAQRRSDRVEREARLTAADDAVDDAPVSDRWRGEPREEQRRRRGPTATRSGRRSSWASIRIRKKKDVISAWARDYWTALHPYSAGGAYVNFMMEEGEDRVRATYGKNYARLAKIKKRFDPSNLFRVNQNIKPK